jgi:hypothetical protein
MARNEMPITIRGKTYANAKEAAAAMNVTRGTIYSALHRNTLDTVGLGTGSRKNKTGGTPRPVTIAGKHFRTLREASVYLGLKRGTLSSILRRGGERSKQNIMRLMMQKTADIENKAVKKMQRGMQE